VNSIRRQLAGTHRFHRCRQRPIPILALTIVVMAGFGTHAEAVSASTVSIRGSIATYTGQTGEDNNVEIRVQHLPGVFSGTDEVFLITDSVGILDFDGNPGFDSCVTLTNLAQCPASEGTLLYIYAHDGDDSVVVHESVGRSVFICGDGGNDTLRGGPGGDRIVGGSGSDDLTGNDGGDLIAGATGALLDCPLESGLGSPAGDRLVGGSGADRLQGSSGPDNLLGGPDGDVLSSGEGDDSLDGGTEDDALVGEGGDDSLHGGSGTDELTGGPGSDSEFGGDGDDEIGTSWSLVPGVVQRDDGDDTIDGGPGNDVLNGGPGALQVTSFLTSLRNIDEGPEVPQQNGTDSLHGGVGRDTVTYVKRATPVVLTLDGQANDGGPGERDRIGADVESVVGGSGDDTIAGSASNDEVDGGKGSDTIDGGPGDDSLSGGRGDEGRDWILGADGNDTLSGLNGPDRVVGGGGRDVVAGGGGEDDLEGGDGDDAMTGGPGGDALAGGLGNDELNGSDPLLLGADGPDDLRGEEGTDSLHGGDGDDQLAGGPGPDALHGGSGLDTADYSVAEGPLAISLDGRANDGEEGEGDNFDSDVEAARGGSEDDVLSGDARANVLAGGSGEDFLEGGTGPDRLDGNDDNDAIQSRDSTRDLVSCGRGFDFAIADDQDLVRDNCELVDRDGGRSPALGRSLSVRLVRGSSRLRPRSMERFFPFQGRTKVPVRSSIDARGGTVELSTRTERRRFRSGALRGGPFMVDQRRSRSPLTDIRLRGGGLERCGRGSKAATDGRPVGRRLWVRASGRVRVVGIRGYALGRKATWTTADRCDGTLVRVRRGRVTVVEEPHGKTFTLTAGEAHLVGR
jgi:Ca2+-binding RTX toxin-like protein